MEIILHNPKDRVWEAVIKEGSDLFIATIICGSATEEWKASLQPISFFSLTLNNPLTLALERGLERLKRQEEFGWEVAKLIEVNPQIEEIVREVMKRGDK